MPKRPNISADLKRKILVEAGHRCAIPTCRNLDVDVHHIIPWEECKKHSYENLIAICPNCHRRTHKGEIDKKSLRLYKNNLRFLYDRFTVFEIDILFELNKLQENDFLEIFPHMTLFIKRIIEAKYVAIFQTPHTILIGRNMKLDPDHMKITKLGREFISSLSNENIGY